MTDDHKRTRTIAVNAVDVRTRIASAVWAVAVVCVVVLVLGALLIALKANPDSGIRNFIVGFADRIDGPLSRDNGLFTFDGKDAEIKSALVNWGIAAVAYFAIGKLLRRVIRP